MSDSDNLFGTVRRKSSWRHITIIGCLWVPHRPVGTIALQRCGWPRRDPPKRGSPPGNESVILMENVIQFKNKGGKGIPALQGGSQARVMMIMLAQVGSGWRWPWILAIEISLVTFMMGTPGRPRRRIPGIHRWRWLSVPFVRWRRR